MPDISGGITGTGRLFGSTSLTSATAAPSGSNWSNPDNQPAPGAFVTEGYTAAVTGSSLLSPAVQTIWSKEILFQAMPILRFEQFAVKKTELGVMPGLTINFMRYNNLEVSDRGAQLTEGVRMTVGALSAHQYRITVVEEGRAVAVSELLLHASFDDVMASGARLLGRHMAQSMDYEARNTLLDAPGSSTTFGYAGGSPWAAANTNLYTPGTIAAGVTAVTTPVAGNATQYYLTPHVVKDGVEILATLNIPRLGETYVQFAHPKQLRRLRDTPEWIEVTKYAAPGNFMLGEVGRLDDVVFIETTQIANGVAKGTTGSEVLPGDSTYASAGALGTATSAVFRSIMIGDNAFGHAISLPVELRDGGVLDFGREHALAWYSIWGFGSITPSAVVEMITN